ncbi:hypothetical protein [Polynucleobacter sp. AP-RePozz3-80-G7]|uniref:hypothetical protein n=1 Tax=Polynucleobacter sp. AP-RePozz3-80-G7 TaxID=2689105 RepID=UPI001C0C4EC0|nr:hypothetical protein [Polynucleobacter sp. AP-RePozz3-80-G7]MBU3640034.1 hypothetical protein [Polynucleobacter sp. AP-RePozz3-80-G7]
MNPLAFLTSGANCLIAILVSSVLSLLGGVYLGHNYEKNYYEAKISKDNLSKEEAYKSQLAIEQAKKDLAIAQLFKELQAEQSKSSGYQSQAKALYLANGTNNPSGNCFVSFGFIRLFNASATGETTSPASTDSITSTIDLDTVLSTAIDNHGKYRQAERQIEAVRAAQ